MKVLKFFAGLGCAIVMIPFFLGFFGAMYESLFKDTIEGPRLEREREARIQVQTDSEAAIRTKLTKLQDWFDDNGLSEELESSRRVKETETVFVDAVGFEKYFSVLNGNSSFDQERDIEYNPFDTAIKTMIDPKLVRDIEPTDFAEYQKQVLSAKYAALYVLGIEMPTKEKVGEFDSGVVVYGFTLVDLENLEVIGGFDGVVENSDEVVFYQGSSALAAAKRDLFENLSKAVNKQLAEEFWVQ